MIRSNESTLMGFMVAVLLMVPPPLYGADWYDVKDAEMVWTNQYGKRLVSELEKAKDEIFVLQYLIMGRGYVPDVQNILETIKNKAKNGVEVTIVADGSRKGEYGNPINSMLHRYFDTGPVDVTVLSPEEVMHSKVIIIDKKVSFIGSQNWSKSGLTENVELAAFVRDAKFSFDLQQQLEKSLSNRVKRSVLEPGEKSINDVSKRELLSVPLIGEHYADKILTYRRRRRVSGVKNLREIAGIGKKRLDVLRRYFGKEAREQYKDGKPMDEPPP